MRIHIPIAFLSVILLLAPSFVGAQQAPAAGAATPTLPPAVETVADTIAQVLASENLRRAALARIADPGPWREPDARVTELGAQLDALASSATTAADLVERLDVDRQLRIIHRSATTAADELDALVRRLERDGNALDADARKWRERLQFLESRQVPAEVVDRVRSIEEKQRHASDSIREYRSHALLALDRAVALQVRIADAHALVYRQQERIVSQRMLSERSSLWQLGATSANFDVVAAEFHVSWRSLRDYLAREGAALAGLFIGVLALTMWLFTRKSGYESASAQRGYGRPLAASLLIALMSVGWLAPDPPAVLYGILLALAPIPTALVARRTFAAPVPLTLYGITFATILLPLRGVIEGSAISGRLLLLAQAICFAVPIAIDLHKGRLQQALPRTNAGVVRAGALFVILAAAVTAFHVLFGFTGPARLVRSGMGSILGFGLVFGTTALALYGAARALLATPLVRGLHSARSEDPALLRALRLVLTVLTVGGVALVALGSLGLGPTLRSAFESLMGSTLEVGTVSIAGKAVVTAFAVAVATFVLAGVTGFVLDREIVPRTNMRAGAGYALVTFTRWVIFVVGAALTLAALGIDMGKVTLLAGALSVGIGFGLQNVVNNFVSGLILMVERPVGVGDVIERGTLSGTVTRIGIRSSTVRTGQGAEVIVPNGDLVSKEVVNWTRSDRKRRYDIDVRVAPDSDPEQVMRLLVEAAGEVPEIISNPPPRAMFKGFGDSSVDFTLLAWVPTVDVGLQAQNALRVAILRKLGAAGIAIPFPQRDLHIVSADHDAAAAKDSVKPD